MTALEALAILVLEPIDVNGVRSQAELDARVQAWKDGPLKKAYRKQAKRWHPDLGGLDDRDERTTLMSQVNTANSLCLAVRLRARQRQPAVRIVRVGYGTYSTTTSATTSTGATYTWSPAGY